MIKSHHKFKYIPIVVFTTSHAGSDIKQSYDFGVNSYITKPASYDELVSLMKTTTDFWLNAVHMHRE